MKPYGSHFLSKAESEIILGMKKKQSLYSGSNVSAWCFNISFQHFVFSLRCLTNYTIMVVNLNELLLQCMVCLLISITPVNSHGSITINKILIRSRSWSTFLLFVLSGWTKTKQITTVVIDLILIIKYEQPSSVHSFIKIIHPNR